jgi:hypothetical protein
MGFLNKILKYIPDKKYRKMEFTSAVSKPNTFVKGNVRRKILKKRIDKA